MILFAVPRKSRHGNARIAGVIILEVAFGDVVPPGELRRRSDVIRRLLLAVEIVSPSSARFDRVRKRPHYQRHRVSEYWIIDDMSQTVERWTPDDERPEQLAERLVWHPEGAAEPFVVDLVEFFKAVAADDD